MFHSFPYRTFAALLALTLLLTGAAPLMVHLCGMGEAPMPVCCAGHDGAEQSAHDRCPMTPPGTADAPVVMACCTTAPVNQATEQVAVAPALPPQLWAAVAPLAAWFVPLSAPAEPPRPLDSGPPNPALRPHLAFSVLLI